VIPERVERLDHEHESTRFENRRRALQRFDHVGRLQLRMEPRVHVARHYGHPSRPGTRSHVHRRAHFRKEPIARGGVARGERRLAPIDRVRDEHSHPHPQSREGTPHTFLLRRGPGPHLVVLDGGEALRPEELELRHQVVAGVRAEHAEMRRVAEAERARRSRPSRGRPGRCRSGRGCRRNTRGERGAQKVAPSHGSVSTMVVRCGL
jgi:hypothetical protein